MKKLDDIHYNFNTINGYHCLFYVTISARDPGKTTRKIIDAWNHHKKTGDGYVFIVRNVNDISEGYLNSFQEVINTFIDPNVELKWHGAAITNGVVDIYDGDRIFIRVQALSKKINAQKRYRLANIKDIVFDEFICNPRFNEKYLPDEYTKFREVIKTYQKDNPSLRVYMLGNPYSLFNPYFSAWGVPLNKLKIGTIITDGSVYVIEFYKMRQELRDQLLKQNPDYMIDEDYAYYALDGGAINDINIRVEEIIPENFYLQFVFRVDRKLIGVYRDGNDNPYEYTYYAKYIEHQPSNRRDIIAFDFGDLFENCVMIASSDRWKYEDFKKSMRLNSIAVSNVEVYHILEEIYKQL